MPSVETGLLVLVGATTENPYFEVNPPLLSRSTLFRLEPLDDDAIGVLLERGLEAEGATAEPAALEQALQDHLAGRHDHAILLNLLLTIDTALADRPGTAGLQATA